MGADEDRLWTEITSLREEQVEQGKALARLEQSAIDSLERLKEFVERSKDEQARCQAAVWKAIRSMRPARTRKQEAAWATLLASLATAAAAALTKLWS